MPMPQDSPVSTPRHAAQSGTARRAGTRRPPPPAPRRACGYPGELLACDACGAVVRPAEVPCLLVRTLGPVRWLAPPRCEPPEYAVRCNRCGAIESFQPAAPDLSPDRGPGPDNAEK